MIIKRSILTIFFTIQNAVSTRGYLMNPLPFGTNTINRIYNQFNNVANGDTMKKYNSKNIEIDKQQLPLSRHKKANLIEALSSMQ